MLNGRPAWSSLLDKWNIEAALLPNESALASLLRERPDAWRITDRTSQATLFERQSKPAPSAETSQKEWRLPMTGSRQLQNQNEL